MSKFELPPSLVEFISVGEATNGGDLAANLFRKKFDTDPPNHGRHFIAYYKRNDGAIFVASYLHMWQRDSMGLIGGGCSDGDIFRLMTPGEAMRINTTGGLLRQTLLYVFNECAEGLDAFFGHCGDPRAKEVDLAAGFQETENEHLLVNWTDPDIETRKKDFLYRKALEIGPF